VKEARHVQYPYRTSGGQAVLSKDAPWKTAKKADGFSIDRSLLMRLSKLARPTLPISNR
jgi:hypothetical protein